MGERPTMTASFTLAPATTDNTPDVGHLPAPGRRVEVQNRFTGAWCSGFEVAEVVANHAYRIRRISDGAELPGIFDEQTVRLAA